MLAEKFHHEFVTGSDGQKKAVIIPIEEYAELMEDLQDLAVIAERHDEPAISHNMVIPTC